MKSPYVAVRAEGVPLIEEGRVFLIDPLDYRTGSLVPPIFDEEGIRLHSKRCEVLVAGKYMPTNCPSCGMLLERHPFKHTYEWMEMLFVCPKHPYTVWFDCSPKANGMDTSLDMTNVWPQYVDTQKQVAIDNDRIAIDGIIEGGITGLERYRQFVNNSPVLFILTPKGLVPIREAFIATGFRGWLDRLWEKLKKIGVGIKIARY